MNPLGHGAVWFRHLGDLREYVAFRRLAFALRLLLFEAFLQRGSFLGCESLGLLAGRGGALGGALTFIHAKLLISKLLDYSLFLSFYSNVEREEVKMTED